jgi:hypothetical protein
LSATGEEEEKDGQDGETGREDKGVPERKQTQEAAGENEAFVENDNPIDQFP